MPPTPHPPPHTRHLLATPAVIVESTYGIENHLPRRVREERFTSKIHATVRAGGRVLLPIVALGRAQVRGGGDFRAAGRLWEGGAGREGWDGNVVCFLIC